MKILITGSSGLIGTALTESWTTQGHTVARLVRSHDRLTDQTALWDPASGEIDIPKLDWIAGTEGFHTVVHLAGENLSKSRWNPEVKEKILSSRISGTTLLTETLRKLEVKPKVYITASAVGFYGSRGSEILNEYSTPGTGFLADVVKAWEEASKPAELWGIRVVNARNGIVLSTKGGMLKTVLPLFKIGLGAPLGEGTQYMSWIAIDDLVRAYNHIIARDDIRGPVNITSPAPVTNLDFSRSLGYHFKAPIAMHAPPFLLKMIIGDMADEMLLSSTRVIPIKLMQTGFKFTHTNLEPALNHILDAKI